MSGSGWLAVGRTDMRRGMNGLALQVQEALDRDPHAGDLFVFRGRRGDMIKIIWHDGFPRHFSTDQAAAYARQPQRIGSRVYANRMGNGDEAGGDGWRYRGRGLIQVTGRSNYAACGTALGLDLIAQPELLEQPGPAARSAGWFWHSNGLNRPADARDIETITRRINGGLTGREDRKAHYAHACAALEVSHEPANFLGDAAAIAANPVAGLAKVALDVAPDIAGLFGDDAEKAVGKLADTVRAITGTDDPDKAREALADPNLVSQLRSQAQTFAHEERMQQMAGALTTLTATLADRQNARARDAEFIKAGRSNVRANVLLVTAGIGIVGGIGFMVFGHVDGNTAVGGCIISVVTLLAGKFATAFDFEFGGSADAEQTRTLLAQAPPIGGK